MRWIWRYKLLLIPLALLTACVVANPRPLAPPPQGDDCSLIHVADYGVHTSLYVEASLLPSSSSLRQRWPEATHFVIGWGEEDFYRHGPTVGRAAKAIIPPSPTVLHAVALARPPEDVFEASTEPVALSQAGTEVFARQVERYIAKDETGRPLVLSEGHYGATSAFFRSTGNYHLLHMCNQWTAGLLRRSGVAINAPISLPSKAVIWQLDAFAAQSCPAE